MKYTTRKIDTMTEKNRYNDWLKTREAPLKSKLSRGDSDLEETMCLAEVASYWSCAQGIYRRELLSCYQLETHWSEIYRRELQTDAKSMDLAQTDANSAWFWTCRCKHLKIFVGPQEGIFNRRYVLRSD